MTEHRGLVAIWYPVAPRNAVERDRPRSCEDLARIANLSTFAGARCYHAVDARLYLVWHETADVCVTRKPAGNDPANVPGDPAMPVREPTDAPVSRYEGRLVRSSGSAPATAVPFLYTVQADCADPARAPAYFDWYDREHLPALASVPGVLRARRYESEAGSPVSLAAYELASPNVFESPAWIEARMASRTDKMRPLFANARRIMHRLIHEVLPH